MPRREDERQLNLTGQHPVYCTCTQCTERFLSRKKSKAGKGILQRLFKRSKGEQVKPHPTDCTCATCALLRSLDDLPPSRGNKSGLFGKK